MKILFVHGSFALLPDVKPLTSTYLLESNGLITYPGLPGTNLAVGKSACPEEACDEDDGFVFASVDRVACVGCVRATRGAAVDRGLEGLSLSVRGCWRREEATSGSAIG
jgi:hypothetical protein